MSSSAGVAAFYSEKNIFITGGTGFLGICLLEKILRSVPNHGNIYLLLRPKKGTPISERLDSIKSNAIFQTILQDKSSEQVFEKVFAVAGNVADENLGLSEADRKLVTSKTHVIIHSAATLDFGDTLKTTVDVNLLGTRRVTQLANDCPNLKVLIHVSSAYVNSWRLNCDEILYPAPVKAEELIKLVNELSAEELEKKTPEILADHPNTYTITKHLAEFEVKSVEKNFPCTIVRPSMITAAWKEPVPGWTISKNGPQGFLMGASKGVIRRLPAAKHLVYDYIPVDIVVNTMLTAGFHAAVTKPSEVTVYHATSSTRNPFRWDSVEDKINVYLHTYPLKSAVWYPTLKLLPSVTWFRISVLFVHMLPAIFLDLVTKIAGGRPILMKLHRNVNSSLGRLELFIFTEWKYDATKTQDLQNWLNASDAENFNTDIKSLKWVDYFIDLTKGVRIYLNKEPLKNLASARSKDNILWILHLALQSSIFLSIWYLFSCFSGLGLWQSSFVLPVAFGLFNLL